VSGTRNGKKSNVKNQGSISSLLQFETDGKFFVDQDKGKLKSSSSSSSSSSTTSSTGNSSDSAPQAQPSMFQHHNQHHNQQQQQQQVKRNFTFDNATMSPSAPLFGNSNDPSAMVKHLNTIDNQSVAHSSNDIDSYFEELGRSEQAELAGKYNGTGTVQQYQQQYDQLYQQSTQQYPQQYPQQFAHQSTVQRMDFTNSADRDVTRNQVQKRQMHAVLVQGVNAVDPALEYTNPIEQKLSTMHRERDNMQQELLKLGTLQGRTMADRRKKANLEASLKLLDHDITALKAQLRTLQR
jgi:hypothetical protein